jgi:nucleoside-diphosphate kinase
MALEAVAIGADAIPSAPRAGKSVHPRPVRSGRRAQLREFAWLAPIYHAILLNYLTNPTVTEKPMAVERTLSIIKPDAVGKNVIGQIYSRFEKAGLTIVAARMKQLSRAEAEGFYAVHRARPFFNDLVNFMISGPVMIQVLQGDNAIAKNRELMGATDPKKADKGTIRADFADSIDANAVHGSDGPDTAAVEIAYFFAALDIHPR